MKEDPGSKNKKKANKKSKKSSNGRWILLISFCTVALTIIMSFVSQEAMSGAGLVVSLVVLLLFILVGILFDILGIAIATANEKPFHSMAAHRERGAKQALRLIRNADKASNFCNDVVGDIAGIVSGTTAAVIVTRLVNAFTWDTVVTTLVISGIVAGLTVGGKAVGKSIAMKNSTAIVHLIGRLLGIFERREKRNKH